LCPAFVELLTPHTKAPETFKQTRQAQERGSECDQKDRAPKE